MAPFRSQCRQYIRNVHSGVIDIPWLFSAAFVYIGRSHKHTRVCKNIFYQRHTRIHKTFLNKHRHRQHHVNFNMQSLRWLDLIMKTAILLPWKTSTDMSHTHTHTHDLIRSLIIVQQTFRQQQQWRAFFFLAHLFSNWLNLYRTCSHFTYTL